jgi:hypothetical protein
MLIAVQHCADSSASKRSRPLINRIHAIKRNASRFQSLVFAPGLQLGAPTKRRVTPEQTSRVTPEQKRRVTPEQKSRVTPDLNTNNERRPSPKEREARPALRSSGALTRAFGGLELAGRPRRSVTPARTATATATAARDGDDSTHGPQSPEQRARETKRQRRSVTPARTATATATAARDDPRATKVCANCGTTRPKRQWHLSTGERLCQACFSYVRYVQYKRAP